MSSMPAVNRRRGPASSPREGNFASSPGGMRRRYPSGSRACRRQPPSPAVPRRVPRRAPRRARACPRGRVPGPTPPAARARPRRRRARRSRARRARMARRTPHDRARGMLHRVGERLLDHAVGAVLDLGRDAHARGERLVVELAARPPAPGRAGCRAWRRAGASVCSSATSRSSSASASFPASRMPAKRAPSSGAASRPAPAWITITARWWATMSCSSRAIRARSRRTASAATASRSASSWRLRSASASFSSPARPHEPSGRPRRDREEQRGTTSPPAIANAAASAATARTPARSEAARRRRARRRTRRSGRRRSTTGRHRQATAENARSVGSALAAEAPSVRRDALARRGQRGRPPSASGPRISSSSAPVR